MAYRCHRPEGTSVHLPMSKANMAAESQNCDKFKNKMKKENAQGKKGKILASQQKSLTS